MPEPTLLDLADKIDDVARVVSRQSATLGALAAAGRDAAGPDLPLLVELSALHNQALGCAGTARSRRERSAFQAIATGLERLLVGRGGEVVAPGAGEAFSAARMEAVGVVPTDDAGRDRTVAELLTPGLAVGDRSVRPARVTVYRQRPS